MQLARYSLTSAAPQQLQPLKTRLDVSTSFGLPEVKYWHMQVGVYVVGLGHGMATFLLRPTCGVCVSWWSRYAAMVFLVAMLSVSETVETKKTMRPHSMMWGLVWVVTQKVVEVTSRSTFLPFMEILLQPLDWYECHCTGLMVC